jgi:deazaflavin-dependent oxidoreductase (nitroreductase family)
MRGFIAIYRRVGPKIDPWLLKVTGGRIATRLYGFPTLVLFTTGAKSGQRRQTPLFYVRDGDAFAIVGTNFGTEHHPAWTNNLTKTPAAEIAVGQESLAVDAKLADDATFERLWPKFSAIYGGYDAYLERLTHRKPRMFVMQPRAR